MFITSYDGVKIAYDVQGDGPALLLLQGLADRRQMWRELGYIDRLCQFYRVITVNRRGIDESNMPTEPCAYTVDKILNDTCVVTDTYKADQFLLRILSGWFYGTPTRIAV
ncbi:MAG: hypothetical protein NVSMB54_01640 [Ktedonobacteraceae bacterium]